MTNYTDKDVAVLIPMLGRTWHITPLLKSLKHSSPRANVLFLVTPSDDLVIGKLDRVGAKYIPVEYQEIGDYARKINVGFENTTEPFILTGASDLRFHRRWAENALACFTPGIGVVGTNDFGEPRTLAGEHATHSVVSREYVNTYGLVDGEKKVLFEGYRHEYCDDELIGTAKMRKAWTWCSTSHVEHLHPVWGKGLWDDMYYADHKRMDKSRETFLERRKLWTRQ